jgi:hypothetical protein
MINHNKKYHLNWIYVGDRETKIMWESFDTWEDLIKKKRIVSGNIRIGAIKTYKSRKW